MLILFNATASFYAHNSFFFNATASFYEQCSFFFPAQRTASSQIFSVLTLRKSARPSSACFSASAKSPIFAPTQV